MKNPIKEKIAEIVKQQTEIQKEIARVLEDDTIDFESGIEQIEEQNEKLDASIKALAAL